MRQYFPEPSKRLSTMNKFSILENPEENEDIPYSTKEKVGNPSEKEAPSVHGEEDMTVNRTHDVETKEEGDHMDLGEMDLDGIEQVCQWTK